MFNIPNFDFPNPNFECLSYWKGCVHNWSIHDGKGLKYKVTRLGLFHFFVYMWRCDDIFLIDVSYNFDYDDIHVVSLHHVDSSSWFVTTIFNLGYRSIRLKNLGFLTTIFLIQLQTHEWEAFVMIVVIWVLLIGGFGVGILSMPCEALHQAWTSLSKSVVWC